MAANDKNDARRGGWARIKSGENQQIGGM